MLDKWKNYVTLPRYWSKLDNSNAKRVTGNARKKFYTETVFPKFMTESAEFLTHPRVKAGFEKNLDKFFTYLQYDLLYSVGHESITNLRGIAQHPQLAKYKDAIAQFHERMPDAESIKDDLMFQTGSTVWSTYMSPEV